MVSDSLVKPLFVGISRTEECVARLGHIMQAARQALQEIVKSLDVQDHCQSPIMLKNEEQGSDRWNFTQKNR